MLGRVQLLSHDLSRRLRGKVRNSRLEFIIENWKEIISHFIIWSILVVFSFLFICLSYYAFYTWYIPLERISRPVYLQYQHQRPSYVLNIDSIRPGVNYDLSLLLLVPDEPSLSEKEGNIMINTKISGTPFVNTLQSYRPTLLTYRSWPVRFTLLALRLWPVVFGLMKEATYHRVFLFENLVINNDGNITISLEVGSKTLPLYSTTLELVAHFTGVRYLMYYWKWTCAIFVVGCLSLWMILFVTISVGVSLYIKVSSKIAAHEDQRSVLDEASSKTESLNGANSLTKSVELVEGYGIKGLRRRRLSTDGMVPVENSSNDSGLEADSEKDQ